MPLAPGLLVRRIPRPGGGMTTVIVRRRSSPAPTGANRVGPAEPVQEKPYRRSPVPACDIVVTTGFSRPVALALSILGDRARPAGRDGVTLDGRQVPLIRMVAEANLRLAAAGRPPIPYPGLRLREFRR